MKLVHKTISKDGKVGLIPEDSDDLWNIYNLIQKGDHVQTQTFRKIINETDTGSTGGRRVKTTLTIVVEKLQFDSEADIVKIKGKNVEENKYVKLGQYHTVSIELDKRFFLVKANWDSLAHSQLTRACDSTRNAEVAVVIMQEGLAYLCLLTTNMSVQKAKIEVNIPRKRKNFCSQHDKGLEHFYEQILQAIVRFINFENIKCVILASPGFLKDQLYEYIWNQATKREYKSILDSREKFLLTHSSSGFKHSIKEILSNPEIQTKLEDTKAVQEVKLWDKFQDLLNTCPDKALYSLKEIEIATACHAVEYLMITDILFRTPELSIRKRISTLIQKVKAKGGEVKILSSMHQTGEQLNNLTGLAAILKFQVPELQVQQNDDSSKEFDDSDSSTTDEDSDLSEGTG